MGTETGLICGLSSGTKEKSSYYQELCICHKTVLHNNDIELNEDRFLLNSITRACSYHHDVAKTRLPIHKYLLKLLLKELNNIFSSQPYLHKLYRALFATAYFGLLGVGELTKGDHPVKAHDVHVGRNKKKLLIILRTSKTHWKNSKPQIIKINSQEINNQDISAKLKFCPYQILKEFSALQKSFKNINEQFFVFSNRTPVTCSQFCAVLKKAIHNCGFDVRLYSVRGFRSGRAGDLLEMGLSVETIKKLGRWKSNAIYKYFKAV